MIFIEYIQYILHIYAICLHMWININYGMQPVADDHSSSLVFSLYFQQQQKKTLSHNYEQSIGNILNLLDIQKQ